MREPTFIRIAGGLFAVIAVLHVCRLVLGWHAVIGSWIVPVWLSWVAILVFGGLAAAAFRLRR